MIYTFDSKVAEEYGVDCAVLISNFQYWIEKNKANDRHFYDGRYWTYNSVKAFQELFPFWSRRQIETILARLIDKNVLIKGNYNSKSYDRTCWYAFHEEEKWISPKCEMDFTELGNGFHQNVEPIPDIKPNSKPNIEKEIYKEKDFVDVDYFVSTWNGPLSNNCNNIAKIFSFDKERVDKLKSVIKMVMPMVPKGEKPERYILKKFQDEYRKSDYLMGEKSIKRTISVDFVLDNYKKIAEGYYKDNNN